MLDRFETSIVIRSRHLSSTELQGAMGAKSAPGYYMTSGLTKELFGFWLFSSGLTAKSTLTDHLRVLELWLNGSKDRLRSLRGRAEIALMIVVYRNYFNIGFELTPEISKILTAMNLQLIVRFVLGNKRDIPRDISELRLV
jgi:hypothetical protein